ncbi:MAG: FKBP-type peptidyl-prolyl cis-trans isomerase [Myxococcales bacterium]|nr:FKBP-type peptidyl-prolyl cis-trans isomerase [Myxococcales bacterium]
MEIVPASILDPEGVEAQEAAKRAEYKLASKEETPIFPAPETAYKTDSGLNFVVFGRGESHVHPMSSTAVTVHYEGRTADGEVFDSSIARGEPTSFSLEQVVPGLREGVKLMTVGDTFRFWIPEKDAYRGAPGKPAGLLIFDVELIDMEPE